jgi:hypothetical protein
MKATNRKIAYRLVHLAKKIRDEIDYHYHMPKTKYTVRGMVLSGLVQGGMYKSVLHELYMADDIDREEDDEKWIVVDSLTSGLWNAMNKHFKSYVGYMNAFYIVSCILTKRAAYRHDRFNMNAYTWMTYSLELEQEIVEKEGYLTYEDIALGVPAHYLRRVVNR